MTTTTVALVALAIALAAACWLVPLSRRVHLALVAAMTAALAAVAVLAVAAGRPGGDTAADRALLVLFAVLAVTGGGPVALQLLGLADGPSRARAQPAGTPPLVRPETLDEGEVLRGGAWIGSLERAGIFAALAAGWPEGLAVVLAVKGVGRYQELRGSPGASERFIIGTFASVLWAAACAGVWWFR